MSESLKIDLMLIFSTFVLSCFTLISYLIEQVFLSWVVVGIVNVYLVSVILIAAIRADKKHKTYECDWKFEWLFPSRTLGVVFLPALAVLIICSFAIFYSLLDKSSLSENVNNSIAALYFSVVTFTTVGFGDISPLTPESRLIVVLEIGSAFLLLVGVFPLLISRITEFTDD